MAVFEFFWGQQPSQLGGVPCLSRVQGTSCIWGLDAGLFGRSRWPLPSLPRAVLPSPLLQFDVLVDSRFMTSRLSAPLPNLATTFRSCCPGTWVVVNRTKARPLLPQPLKKTRLGSSVDLPSPLKLPSEYLKVKMG